MKTATVTYRSPPGDAKDVIMDGVAFSDGKAVKINSYDNPHLMSKLQGSTALFDVEVGKEDNQPPPKVKRGRPSNADIAAAKATSEQADRDAKTAKEKADMAKSDHEKLSKATDRDVTPPSGAKQNVKDGMSEATGHDFEKDRQNEIARRDAQAKEIGPGEDRPDNQRPVGQTATGAQNQTNQGYGQGQGQNQGNPPGGGFNR